MVTVSHVVKKIVDSKPLLQESLIEGIVNFSHLAQKIRPRVESELGEKIKLSAIIMALRRHADQLQKKTIVHIPFQMRPEIIMKTNICDICIVKTPSALGKIKKIHDIIDYEKGETLNVIQGDYEITIVASQKYENHINSYLEGEKVLNRETDLVSLTLNLTKEFSYTPGVLSSFTRRLAWENINILENISTMTELIFIISEEDALRAYSSLHELIKEQELPV
jgi:aspartokinase